MAARTPVIVGIGWSDSPIAPHLDSLQHHALAMHRALADCGIAKSKIDGSGSLMRLVQYRMNRVTFSVLRASVATSTCLDLCPWMRRKLRSALSIPAAIPPLDHLAGILDPLRAAAGLPLSLR